MIEVELRSETNIERLEERIKIAFPHSLEMGEFQGGFLKHLALWGGFNISYTLACRGDVVGVKKSWNDPCVSIDEVIQKVYFTEMNAKIGKGIVAYFKAELERNFCKGINFSLRPAYNSNEPAEKQLRAWEYQLKIIEAVQDGVQSYFSQRPK